MLIDRKNKYYGIQPTYDNIICVFIIFVLLFLVVQNSKPDGSVNIILFGDEEKLGEKLVQLIINLLKY